MSDVLSVADSARRLGARPRDISTLFYDGKLRDDLCPVVGGRRLIPESYLPFIAAALKRSGTGAAFEPFPTEELPAPLAKFIHEVAAAVGCDESGVALLLLAALASAIGNSWQIRIRDGWYEPAILWVMLVALTGSKKTPIVKAAMQFIHERQRELAQKYRQALATYETELAAWAAMPKDSRSAEKPVKPTYPHVYVDDTTLEGLAAILELSPRGLLLVKDELSAWLKSFNAYKGGVGGDEQSYLPMFNALRLKITRKSAEQPVIDVDRSSVSIAGGIQPSVLAGMFTPDRYANGLASRFLFVYPPEREGPAWTDAKVDPATRTGVADIFRELYRMEPVAGKPETMELSAEAKELYREFANGLKIERLKAKLDAVASLFDPQTPCSLRDIQYLPRVASEQEEKNENA